MAGLKETDTLQDLKNARLFVCFLAPFYLLLEDTGCVLVRAMVKSLGKKVLKGFIEHGATNMQFNYIKIALRDFKEEM